VLWLEFARRAGLDEDARLSDVVEAIRHIPYGRPTDRTPAGVLYCDVAERERVILALSSAADGAEGYTNMSGSGDVPGGQPG
jgi:hypothetical protein